MNKTLRVRACRTTGELEIEGSPELVAEWWDRLALDFTIPALQLLSPIAASPLTRQGDTTMDQRSPAVSFGEVLHQFPSEISDTDRILIAGLFIQSTRTEAGFSTRAASDLLVEQGYRISNPSECVRRLVESRRAFRVGERTFRVSASGLEYTNSLKSS